MLFSSVFFLFAFLPVSLIVYYLCPRAAKNAVLVLLSLVFYAWGGPKDLVLLCLTALMSWAAGLELSLLLARGKRGLARFTLWTAALLQLLPLLFYKYTDFLLGGVFSLFGVPFSAPELRAPVGISFFTFQALSCLWDIYRGKAEATRNLIDHALYISFFPKLLSGPIVPYQQMQPQLRAHPVSLSDAAEATPMILAGLAKKVLISDQLAVCFSSIQALDAASLSAGTAWLGALCYTFQLYFDFSGYSDMAIGLARLFGFRFEANFNYPYTAVGLRDFWNRWHISLSHWFRDYVYIPLGGSKAGTAKQIRNLLLVWLLTGVWHGASMSFVVWGLYHGVLLLLTRYPLRGLLEKIPAAVRRVGTFFLVVIGWVFFFSPTLSQAFGYLARMFRGALLDGTAKYYFSANWLLLLLAVFGCTPLPRTVWSNLVNRGSALRRVLAALVCLGVFVLCVSCMIASTYQSFLYFQF